MIYTFVCENFTGTLADFLRRSGVSGRQITRLREKEGLIRLNGRAAFTDCRVGHGDVVEIDVRESGVDVPPLALPLDMIYEDDHLCVVNKPAGLAVIATRAHYGKSLQNALAAEWGSGFVFHPVTRLDKDTSGVMIEKRRNRQKVSRRHKRRQWRRRNNRRAGLPPGRRDEANRLPDGEKSGNCVQYR